MKYSKDQIEQARKMLASLKPGDTVYTSVRHVSRSGMSRRIRLYITDGDGIQDITWAVARILGDPMNDQGLSVGGCGMDMCFATVYNLSSALFQDGFDCAVERCHSCDHSNAHYHPAPKGTCLDHVKRQTGVCKNKACKPWHHSDGGYALVKRDL